MPYLRVLTSFSDFLSIPIHNFAFMKVTNRDDESEILQRYYNFSNIIPLGGCGGPEKDQVLWSSPHSYCLSPQIHLASCMSLGWMVTRFACIAHKFESSNNCTKYASAASCNTNIIAGVTLYPTPCPCRISQTKH